jgi:hypothetical protein
MHTSSCASAQNISAIQQVTSNEIQLIPPVWPFAQWGIDIVGPLPTALGNYTHMVLAVEYLSKWVEAKLLLM